LLISTSVTADIMASTLTDALKAGGAGCANHDVAAAFDHQTNAALLGSHISDEVSAVVILTGPRNGNPDEECARRGQDYVRHLLRIAREIVAIDEMPPRVYVVTRNAQTVLPSDVPNLEQAGLRGLVRAISTEVSASARHQVDVDEVTGAEQLARQLWDVGGGRDGLASGEWHAARLSPTPLRPEERRTAVVTHPHEGMRLQIRTPGDLETMELTAFDRFPPGAGEIEVAVTASSLNFADVLHALGRYPGIEGMHHNSAWILQAL